MRSDQTKRQAIQTKDALREHLATKGIALYAYSVIDSTNTQAKRIAQQIALPALLMADGQSAGRGRMGRSFFSPDGTGLYCSFVFEKDADLTGITALSAVAAMRAIFTVTGLETQIKWVNDLYRNGKKVAGILAESFSLSDRRFVVLGFGINLTTEDFPSELRARADSLRLATDCRFALVDALCEELTSFLRRQQTGEGIPWIEAYRRASLVLGKRVIYTQNGREQEGIAEEIGEDGSLLVRREDGSYHRLVGGEISLSLKM